MTSRKSVLSIYKNLTRLIQALPPKQKPERQLQELRQTFHKNASLTDPIQIKECIQQAGEKIAYLRIMTPKRSVGSDAADSNGRKRWVYTKDGAVQIEGEGAKRDGGRVLSNWDGKNMDPCAMKTHNGQLRRMGFQNNLHAKGLF
jgi:hypothetical protein